MPWYWDLLDCLWLRCGPQQATVSALLAASTEALSPDVLLFLDPAWPSLAKTACALVESSLRRIITRLWLLNAPLSPTKNLLHIDRLSQKARCRLNISLHGAQRNWCLRPLMTVDQAGIQEDRSRTGAPPAHIACSPIAVTEEFQYVGFRFLLHLSTEPFLHGWLKELHLVVEQSHVFGEDKVAGELFDFTHRGSGWLWHVCRQNPHRVLDVTPFLVDRDANPQSRPENLWLISIQKFTCRSRFGIEDLKATMMRHSLASSLMDLQDLCKLGDVPWTRSPVDGILSELQFSFQIENTAVITTFDFQLQLFGKFAVEVVDVLLGTHKQKVINVHRDECHLLFVLEDGTLEVDEAIALAHVNEKLVPLRGCRSFSWKTSFQSPKAHSITMLSSLHRPNRDFDQNCCNLGHLKKSITNIQRCYCQSMQLKTINIFTTASGVVRLKVSALLQSPSRNSRATSLALLRHFPRNLQSRTKRVSNLTHCSTSTSANTVPMASSCRSRPSSSCTASASSQASSSGETLGCPAPSS